MGLLDDAIREHLDLKRRRGADPAEVERAEREALGPVRREPEPLIDDEAADQALPYDAQAEEPYGDEPEYDPEAAYETGPAAAGGPYDEGDEEPFGEEPPPAPRFSREPRFADREQLPDEDEPEPFAD